MPNPPQSHSMPPPRRRATRPQRGPVLLLLAVLVTANLASSAHATTAYKSGSAWGNGVPDSGDAGATMHSDYGADAVRIREGDGATTNNISNYSIGTQVIDSVNGDGNALSGLSLSGGNSGQVRNQGINGSGTNADSTN